MSTNMLLKRSTQLLIASSYLILIACGGITEKQDSAPRHAPDVSDIPDAIPKKEKIRPQNQKSYVVLGKRYYPMTSNVGYRERGIASWYGNKFHGNPTATGERYDMYKMTAAHKTLPLPSYVEVKNLDNGRKVVVRVNDRGPFHGGRIIDLSYTAATKLGIISRGTGNVEVRAITSADKTDYAQAKVPTQQLASIETTVINPAGLYLQVGTFSTSSRAEQFKTKLQQNINDTVLVVPFNKSEGRLYRVRIGPLVNIEYGDSLATRLLGLGFNDTHVVVE